MRIGIMGGTFSPPHLGHLMMAQQVGTQLALDTVWFMPNGQPPHATHKQTIAAHHRVKMTELAIEGNPLFQLQLHEVNKNGKSYTVDTMREFKVQYPQAEFYFIIGTDSANDLHTWRQIDDLLELVTFVGVKRYGEPEYQGNYPIHWVESPFIGLSSTDIRRRVHDGQSIRYQVPYAVEQYIAQHHLYQREGE